jgi:hypothetical protein
MERLMLGGTPGAIGERMMRRLLDVLTVGAVLCIVGHATPAAADLILLGTSDDAIGYRLVQDGGPGYNPTVVSEGPLTGLTTGFESYQLCRNGISWATCRYNILEVRFNTPTDLVQITGQFFTDAPFMIAYDAFDNPLASSLNGAPLGSAFTTTYTSLPGSGFNWEQELTLTRASRDIARIVYGGDNQVLLTRVSYQVPEPSTIGLLLLGLATTRLLRRRSSRAVTVR